MSNATIQSAIDASKAWSTCIIYLDSSGKAQHWMPDGELWFDLPDKSVVGLLTVEAPSTSDSKPGWIYRMDYSIASPGAEELTGEEMIAIVDSVRMHFRCIAEKREGQPQTMNYLDPK